MHLKTQERVPRDLLGLLSAQLSSLWCYIQAVSRLDLPGLQALDPHLKETSKFHLRYSPLCAL